MAELFRKHQADEMLRKRHQGHGKRMITFVMKDTRFVGVGMRIAYSNRWRFFPDFLLDNLKDVMDRAWGAGAIKSMPDLPLFRWLRRFQQARTEAGPGKPLPYRGYLAAVNRLGYALYLIEHNDKPSKSLITRLKHPNTFDAAAYEALVASAFALAGASIDGAEDAQGNNRKPEFFATFQSGKRYAVEAKRRQKWTAPFNLDSEEFATELGKWLRGKLHAASSKELENPVFWFELGIGTSLDSKSARRLGDLIGKAISDAEDITVKGKPAAPAYVVVTNNSDFADDEAEGGATFALFLGFRMEDFREEKVELEVAMELHDKHREIRRVLECLEEVQQVPTSFDGVPDELLDEHGEPIKTFKIGGQLGYTRPDGTTAFGRITTVTTNENEALAAVYDPETDKAFIIRVPLSEQEAKAAAKLGDAIFGKPTGPHEVITEPMRFYDRMLETHANYQRPYLLRQLEKHPNFPAFEQLSDAELRIRVARETTRQVVTMSDRDTKNAKPQESG
ncbi:hypothetical protein [Mesorhizobium sp. M1272]|uniref:hypothetical protein n=1 Tax=Mesorhizobium sp. M1272 TaxID=2957074 RepID=UPI00333D231D